MARLRFNLPISLSLPKEVRVSFMLVYLLTLIQLLILLSSYFRIQPEVPLWYSLANPKDQLTQKAWLWLLPSTSVAIATTHTLLASVALKHGALLARLFGWATLVVIVLLSLSLLRIILIIG